MAATINPACAEAEKQADDRPMVSIGLFVYNAEAYIAQAIEKLLAQDYPNMELVISDNCSEDATAEICKTYAEKDGRIRFHRNPENLGVVANSRKVLDLARGKYFMWAAHDDQWDSRFISSIMKGLLAHPECVIGFCQLHEFEVETGQRKPDNPLYDPPEYNLSDRPARQQLTHLSKICSWMFYGIHKTETLRKIYVQDASDFYPGYSEIVLLYDELAHGPAYIVREKLFFSGRVARPGWLDRKYSLYFLAYHWSPLFEHMTRRILANRQAGLREKLAHFSALMGYLFRQVKKFVPSGRRGFQFLFRRTGPRFIKSVLLGMLIANVAARRINRFFIDNLHIPMPEYSVNP